MRVIGPGVGKRRQLAAEFDDELIALHPVVEHAEFVADRGDRIGGGGFLRADEWIRHSFSSRTALPLAIFALSSAQSGMVGSQSVPGLLSTNG